jgi:hypothetical protein
MAKDNFKQRVRRRMKKTGESYSIAKARLEQERVEIKVTGMVVAEDGNVVPHREIRTHRATTIEQLGKALFGPDWRPPTKRCASCHVGITHDGYCHCNPDPRWFEGITETVTLLPMDGDDEDQEESNADESLRQAIREWLALPPVSISQDLASCTIAASIGCFTCSAEAAEATGLISMPPVPPDEVAFSEIKLEVDGEFRRFRLPLELGWWACEQAANADDNDEAFPAFFSLIKSDEKYEVVLVPLHTGR